jgi:hypothetical protein
MRKKYTDIQESLEGDLIVENGDFADTEENTSLTVQQIIRTLLNTEPGGFRYFENFGFDPQAYEGRTNTKTLGIELARTVQTIIAEYTILYYSEIVVTPFPINAESIALKIETPTLIGSSKTFTIVYNTSENKFKSVVPIRKDGDPVTVIKTLPPTINSRA